MTGQKQERAGPEGRAASYWEDARKRIDAVQAVLREGWAPTPREKRAILKARAEALARPPAEQEEAGEQVQLVTFVLGGEAYGVESSYIREVSPLRGLTPVPCTPSFVAGIVNLRGQVLSVVDIKQVLGVPGGDATLSSSVVIVEDSEMWFGILADAVLGARSVKTSDIRSLPPTLSGTRAEYTKGLTADRVAILDTGAILADARLRVHEEVKIGLEG